jgi:hypothetical protein
VLREEGAWFVYRDVDERLHQFATSPLGHLGVPG